MTNQKNSLTIHKAAGYEYLFLKSDSYFKVEYNKIW